MAQNIFGQVFKQRGKWYVKWPNGRKTPRGRTAYTVRAVSSEAKGGKFLRELRAAKLGGSLREEPARAAGGMTVTEAVRAYVDEKRAEGKAAGTLEGYEIGLKAIEASGLGGVVVQRVTAQDIKAHLSWRRTHTWRSRAQKGGSVIAKWARGHVASPGLLAREWALLSGTFNRLGLKQNPAASARAAVPKPRQKPRRYLGKEEVRRLLAACDPNHLRPIVLTGLLSGARKCELVRLRWCDVSFETRTISIYRPKTGTASTIPLHPLLARELQELKERRSEARGRIPRADDHIFLSRLGRPYASFRAAWNAAVRRAGLAGRGVTFHSCRHTFACHYLEHGNVRDLQGVLGHSRLSTTEIYAKAMDTRTRVSLEAMDYGLKHTPDTYAPKQRAREA